MVDDLQKLKRKCFGSPEEFFKYGGSSVMKLSPDSAIKVCQMGVSKGLICSIIEGGLWMGGQSYQSRLDCIWHRPYDLDMDIDAANDAGIEFILEERDRHDLFLVSFQDHQDVSSG